MNEATRRERLEAMRALMNEHGLYAWRIIVNTRAKRRNGMCNYTDEIIEVAAVLLRADFPYSEFWNTVTHEVAHALAGYDAGHGPAFVRQHKALGGDGTRLAQVVKGFEQQHKWTGTCPGGHTSKRDRLTPKAKVVSCAQCSPTYDARYKFEWKRNF
jgi:hypothetical protein